jgi:uncharacterized membrane protein YqhA
METVFRIRYLSLIAVVFGAVGAALMFVIGAVSAVDAIVTTSEDKAFSSDAALASTVELVSALDQFLLGLVLLVFAYGVNSLWVVADTEAWEEERTRLRAPDWLHVTSVTDLKVKLIEVIAVLLAVLFLKGVLLNPDVEFSDLVVPIAVVLLAWTIWLIRRSEPR